jgi:hypothetical protein
MRRQRPLLPRRGVEGISVGLGDEHVMSIVFEPVFWFQPDESGRVASLRVV